MTSFGRLFRKLFYSGIFVFLIAWFFYYSYKIYFPVLPTCYDNIQNQGETGIDCGDVCSNECPPEPPPADTKPIDVIWQRVFNNDAGTYDLAAKVSNSNPLWGLVEYKYNFVARDSNDSVVIEKSGTSYLLPNSEDYVIVSNIKSDKSPVKAELTIVKEGQKWASIESDYALSLPFREKKYETRSETGYPALSAILKNATTYDFDSIDIKIVLYNQNEEPIAVNVTNQKTMRAGEERLFRVFWHVDPPGTVFNYDLKASTNVFDSENFMRRFGTGDKIRITR